MSTNPLPKRLIEVDLPIKRISEHARREKSIRHGHISTLHIWWARRPLAACRAVICAALWPDPADPNCPGYFRNEAARVINDFAANAASSKDLAEHCSHDTWVKWQALAKGGGIDPTKKEHSNVLRFALLDFIADFANWDNSTVPQYLEAARALTQAAHEGLGGLSGTRPLVVDPFAGGGAIPLEALRVGADTFASDLNPVAVLLNKVVLEYIPKYGQRLAVEFEKWGERIRQEAEKELAKFYPKRKGAPGELRNKPLLLINAKPDGRLSYVTVTDVQEQLDSHGGEYTHYVPITDGQVHGPTAMNAMLVDAVRPSKRHSDDRLKELGAKPLKLLEETPIAYIWARTVQCEGPRCGAEVPLIRSLWLSKKSGRPTALRLVPDTATKSVGSRIIVRQNAAWRDQESSEVTKEPRFEGTIKRGSATCPVCGYTTPVSRIRDQFKRKHGGTSDARLLCVVTTRANEQGRSYRLPTEGDLRAIREAKAQIAQSNGRRNEPPGFVPNETISLNEIRRISAPIYGMGTWGELFTDRQALAVATLAKLVGAVTEQAGQDEIHRAVQTLLAFAVDRQADYNSSICRWVSSGEFVGNTFGRQAIPMVWDFCEVSPLSDATGGFSGACEWILNVIKREMTCNSQPGHVDMASATAHPLPSGSAEAFITDPPYYDAVPYAYLSDFFYVWLKRSLRSLHSDILSDESTPKPAEIVVDRPHELSTSTKDIGFYERELTKAFAEGRRILRPEGIGTIVFASKTTASWEAILKAVVDAGWTVTGSWPIDTEMESRVAAQGQARLASSIHLVCRSRESSTNEEVGDWRDVLQELPRRIHDWMPRLSQEGIVGADAIFACLGPALEVFSRYERVEKASGERVALREYLEHVWSAVAKEALTMVFKGADASGFEEDARLTAMWLWTLSAAQDGGEAESQDIDEQEDEEQSSRLAVGGYILEYDAARKIAQGLGAHLESLSSLIEIKGDVARLLSVPERTRKLFGSQETAAVGTTRKKKPPQLQLGFVDELAQAEETGAWGGKGGPELGATVLDRVHQSMILFGGNRGEALRRFLVDEGVGKDERFWRLAQVLSYLYPKSSDEKRWIDGVLGRKKGLGL